ncbi:MAG TPA: PaaI family thioesterase [Terriglobales bacterium]|jgi:uncharacterized protein (TIGR00369 family)|nr:PaaI family thioesterase [Terriglobales bacterium]
MNCNRELVAEIFERATFIRDLGIVVTGCDSGSCDTELQMRPPLQQQHGFLHAAVITAMADHTAGAAGATLMQAGQDVITVEFKVSFLRPAVGPLFACHARVLRAGKDLIFTEADVVGCTGRESPTKLLAKFCGTLKIIPHTYL